MLTVVPLLHQQLSPEPALFEAQGTATNISCNGEADGTATINVTGGTAPYTYNWTGVPASEETFVSQSFESSGSWNYNLDPGVYNSEGNPIVSGSEDVWNIIEDLQALLLTLQKGHISLECRILIILMAEVVSHIALHLCLLTFQRRMK